MVVKRKKPAKKRTRRKKPSKGFLKWVPRIALAVLFVALATGVLWVLLKKRGIDPDLVDSVLIAARVDLTTQKQKVIEDGIERWKINLGSEETHRAVVKALEKSVKAQNGLWKPGPLTKREKQLFQIIELEKADGSPLRLIFEIERNPPKRPPPSPSRNQSVAVQSPDIDSGKPVIAIIIDDIGHKQVGHLDPLLNLKFPVTFAVLPFLKYSKANAIYFHQNQYEVMLHMPMEPDTYPKSDPGKGAIFSRLNDAEIRHAINKALDSIPFISGVNNHMGSKITASRAMMRPILDEVKKRDLYFVDSRTQNNTVAFSLASMMGLRAAKRDVFLDAEPTYQFAMKQLQEVRRVAKQQGVAVAIGHPYPSTLLALAEEMPKLGREGFRFVFASQIVKAVEERL